MERWNTAARKCSRETSGCLVGARHGLSKVWNVCVSVCGSVRDVLWNDGILQPGSAQG